MHHRVMSLFERAIEFAEKGAPRAQGELLLECIRARTLDGLAAVQRLYEDMYGGFTFNLELKAPAALCLLCWHERGVDALIEGAQRTPTSKNRSLAIEVLSMVAARLEPGFVDVMLPDEVREVVRESLRQSTSLSAYARQCLTGYMLSLPSDGEAAEVAAWAFHSWSRYGGGAESAKEMFAALATRWLVIGNPTIARYRQLILDSPASEKVFQKFLEDVPQLIDPLCSEVWPRPDFHGAMEPDFVLRRSDDSYLIVEIETPAKTLVTEGLQLSAQATQAITQALQYRAFLQERPAEAKACFPNFRDPECLVVIGLERSLNAPQRKALALENEHRSGLRIVGFDWIADRAERIRQNMISKNIAVRPLRMI